MENQEENRYPQKTGIPWTGPQAQAQARKDMSYNKTVLNLKSVKTVSMTFKKPNRSLKLCWNTCPAALEFNARPLLKSTPSPRVTPSAKRPRGTAGGGAARNLKARR